MISYFLQKCCGLDLSSNLLQYLVFRKLWAGIGETRAFNFQRSWSFNWIQSPIPLHWYLIKIARITDTLNSSCLENNKTALKITPLKLKALKTIFCLKMLYMEYYNFSLQFKVKIKNNFNLSLKLKALKTQLSLTMLYTNYYNFQYIQHTSPIQIKIYKYFFNKHENFYRKIKK